jgi:hypothetical protein
MCIVTKKELFHAICFIFQGSYLAWNVYSEKCALNYELLLQLMLTVPPDMQTVLQLCNPSPESDFQLHEILCQFWIVFPHDASITFLKCYT